MKDRGQDPRALDLLALCRHAGTLQGQWPVAGMERFAASLSAATDACAGWSARGSLVPVAGAAAEVWLELVAGAEAPLLCQRCLQPLVQALSVQRRFRFVRSEEEAALLDEESDDDVLSLPPRLDLHALLEDELILALPIVPRHVVCPEPLPLADDLAEGDGAVPNPFAALAALRGRAAGGDT